MTTSVLSQYEIDVDDVEYLRHGNRPLLARLYKPRGKGPFPLIVDLHGGGWNRKDRMTDVGTDEPLAKSGAVVASLDFRLQLATHVLPKTQAEQLRDAVLELEKLQDAGRSHDCWQKSNLTK